MKFIIFGCGQGGMAAKSRLKSGSTLLAFADNDKSKHGMTIDGIPVVPPSAIPLLSPDTVIIAVLKREAVIAIREQLSSIGYSGKVIAVTELRDFMDLRLSTARLLAAEINDQAINGAVAELGVYKGEFAAEINAMLPDRELFLFDTFEGFDKNEAAIDTASGFSRSKSGDFGDTDVSYVLSRMPHPEKVHICKGRFPDTFPADLPELCLVSLDPDLYEPTRAGLEHFWPKLVKGGVIIVHDYNSSQFAGVKKAVREFCEKNCLFPIPLPDLHGSVVLVKQ